MDIRAQCRGCGGRGNQSSRSGPPSRGARPDAPSRGTTIIDPMADVDRPLAAGARSPREKLREPSGLGEAVETEPAHQARRAFEPAQLDHVITGDGKKLPVGVDGVDTAAELPQPPNLLD